MRVLDHTGITRTRAADHFSQYDLILTTYGTLRRDAAFLKDTTFDYVILDEAQAIKNSSTEAAKATRLLRGRHRQRFLVKAGREVRLQPILREWLSRVRTAGSARIQIDIDPYSFL